MIRAVLSIGANMDRARDNLTGVQAFFADELVAASKIYATPPWGGVEQGDFLNAVLIVDTSRTPMELLEAGWKLENDAGRVREIHWGPRALDVDIVQVIDKDTGEEIISDDSTLTLPHPWATERAFVLVPWLDADPDAELEGVRVAELVDKLAPEDVNAVRLADSADGEEA
ncbi:MULTISPECIES: 2-amino-4-hydroxy-6-hydroxymethyldihydropteridine diphosphokinase [Corynebacterium]|uniref:2-amino-4-hydroxy-6- hydroxymethyldihydropteridine diphosphokinase n=1 Tax=Corynebacterium TaxID=1716 RepID=UPI0006694E3E|nr:MULTISPECIES: 2-amino-4-hydroxy-6-hydroxymethyldihydropteridine diphosphokinase [Corynebacterium]MDC7116548.1 2-amino-4-hydroxy-6-hydroxymethyldihydropteridine diphosphokinase [Corynebacterium amycolatum]ODQ43470.1 2-amino-4-hydroxy-6-hydroxymethyldihydropteridine diphosphokinase [Corynebacterium amycolatum]